MQRDVTVTFNSSTKSISVAPDPVQAKKSVDGVTWAGSNEFTIVLQGQSYPATGSGGRWTVSAGPWNDTGRIKYDVTAPGYNDLDPEVDVIP